MWHNLIRRTATDKEQRTTDLMFANMKRLIALTLICLLFFMSQQESNADTWQRVKWVIDGDTIVISNGHKVRYIGIDAPELEHDDHEAEPYGVEAKRFNASLVNRKNVRLEFDKERNDQYERLLAYVFLKDGAFVNAEILSNGYAYLLYHRPNIKHNSVMLQSQRAAMSAKKGIWQNWTEHKENYVANKRSRRFHLPTCPYGKRIKPRNQVVFQKKWEAFWEGYAPAKRCLPVFEIPKN
jgi:micrococcal nuclease